ncbi:hybrid sensor histidine kinase/response regulator [Pseudanabaena sp. ABRG5-3]|uniref:hybrid sensor histidine kinase/response regulator n=1 Tax=Pseudanabaena sp. ABRG5-3 TaxID=685565 RepID=UPI000DC72331|nr:hybrid sensor histidine kinase/response regulator [Pseudanabaena sp. ABRG5-3]BBC25358.1 signal transduction histidine kinase [Pseudanabaena sp. ABRG5-3]
MNSEQQQQRIMGYFIEEAREHLQTIEQGVLNLQDILDEPESINELFRAAHSIKGGAAMLGVGSIQHVAHRLEDFFKILKENPQIKVDERLKSLLLAGFDPLAELLDELQNGFRVSDELTIETNNRVKPVFAELESYLNQLVSSSNAQSTAQVSSQSTSIAEKPKSLASLESIFQEEVTAKMRDMLQLFRSGDSPESRSQLQEICNYFQETGNNFDLRNWTNLSTQIKNAIAQPTNSYRTLAPILIRELKDAQDLVLAKREAEISISSQIQNLLPYRFSDSEDDEVSTIFTTASGNINDDEAFIEDFQVAESEGSKDLNLIEPMEQQASSADIVDLFADSDDIANYSNEEEFDLLELPQEQIDQMDWMDSEYEITENQHIDGPKVGASELKSLAVLFENDDIDFDSAWEDIESNETNISNHGSEQTTNNNHDEFADLLENTSANLKSGDSTDLGLEESSIAQLFGDFSADETIDNLTATGESSQGLFPEELDDQNLFPDDINITVSSNSQLETEHDPVGLDALIDDELDKELIVDDSIDQGFDDFDLGIEIIDQISESESHNINVDDIDFTEGLDQLAAQPIGEDLLTSQGDFDSLSSEEYFAELERQENEISNLSSNDFHEIEEPNEPFALTLSEESMALLEDPFAISDNLDMDFLDTPANITDSDVSKSDEDIFPKEFSEEIDIDNNSPIILSSDDFDTSDTSGLNIFDELGFDNDEFEEEIAAPTDHSNDEQNFLENLDNIDELANHPISSNSDADLNEDLSFPTSDNFEPSFDEFIDADAVNGNDDVDGLFADSLEVENSDHAEVISTTDDLTYNFADFDEDGIDPTISIADELDDFFSNEVESAETKPAATDSDESISNLQNTDELGDFFGDVAEPDLVPSLSNNEASNLDELDGFGDFFDGEDADTDNSANIDENGEEFSQGLDNINELADFFATSESPENLAEDSIDDNWSDLSTSDEQNIVDVEDELNDSISSLESNLDSAINAEFIDLDKDSNSLEEIEDEFQIDQTSSSGNDDNLVNLFTNAKEDDLTILENDINTFGDDFDFQEMRSPSQDLHQENDINFDGLGDLENNNLANAVNSLVSQTQTSIDDALTTVQDDLDFDVPEEDITASSTIDSLVDFFQADDDLDNTDLNSSTSLINNDDFSVNEANEALDFGEFNELTDLNGAGLEVSDMSDIPMAEDFENQSLAIDNQSPSEELNGIDDNFDFDDLEAMIGNSSNLPNESNESANGEFTSQLTDLNQSNGHQSSDADDMNFDELEALLGDSGSFDITAKTATATKDEGDTLTAIANNKPTDDFDELENMLQSAFAKDVGPIKTKTPTRPPAAPRKQRLTDSTMRVDVKYLDSLNNLVGELVVNRNLLEQEQERLQQFITNLLHQVQLLSDVSQRMRDQYDRSLLEASLTAGRGRSYSSFDAGYSSSTDGATSSSNVSSDFEGIEFDRYNTFHVLSQEIIELIVRVRESASDIEFVVGETDQVTRQLGTITTQVQDDLKQSRMVPFAQIADRLPRGIRDRALKTGKQAELEIYGRETLIDKAILESLTDPLTHLVNNAIDHGLEDPVTRQAAGKSATGKLTVRAYHQGNQTVISISDDGAGISTDKVKKSAVAKGIRSQSEVDRLNDTEVYALLFEAGFSTAAQADEFKGRGVGLDVVKTCLDDIRGVIIVESVVGKGTTFTIRLPLTLSISKAMFCISDRARIAFPVDGFEDMVEVPQSQIVLNEKGQPCLPWRDTVLPFQHLSNLLSYSRHLSRSNIYGKQDNDELCIIILRNDTSYLALQVDQFLGEYEIVIKQLEGPIPQPAGIAGATVLGDGRVMAIANVLELFDIASGRLRPSASGITIQPTIEEDVAVDPTVLIVDDSITVRELLSLTFAKVGYRVEQAKDGQDAWEKLRAGLPCDMIFCDIEMPRMDGLDLLSRLQKDSRLKDIPVAMLTSRGADRHRQTAIQLGAKGYFTKPYLEEELLSASKRLLNGETLPI